MSSNTDSTIYVRTLHVGNEQEDVFEITGTGATSLITPNSTNTSYDVSQTSFVVGSDRLNDDPDATGNKDKRMLFDKTKGAFRAGIATGSQWDSSNRGNYSAAFGSNNIASGISSFAVGTNNTVNGENTISLGNLNTVSINTGGTSAIAIGSSNNIVGTSQYAIAIGQYNTTSTGNNSVLIGDTNTSGSSHHSIAIGHTNTSSGSDSVAIGEFNTASGANSFAIGYGDSTSIRNTASGIGSIAIGHNNTSSGVDSVALGTNATVSQSFSFLWNGDNTLGTTAVSRELTSGDASGSAFFWCAATGVFRINFGAASTATQTSSATGFAWSVASDINLKENLVEHNYSDTLARIMDMPIYTYNFKSVAPGIKSIGPVAQDFNRLFPSDKDPLSIVDRDMCGVALAGVRGVKLGLDSLSESTDSRINALELRVATLEAALSAR